MEPMKIEWTHPSHLMRKEKADSVDRDLVPEGLSPCVPVVRLAAVDAILGEAVWAMETIVSTPCIPHEHGRAQAFLASPAVTDWEKRQGGK